MYSTLDFSPMKAAWAFSLPPPYHSGEPARRLPHCARLQKGQCSLMPVSWKWVTAACHVADLYPDGALCSGTKEHGFPPIVDIQGCYRDRCSRQTEGKEQTRASSKMWGLKLQAASPCGYDSSSAGWRVGCFFYMLCFPSTIVMNWKIAFVFKWLQLTTQPWHDKNPFWS